MVPCHRPVGWLLVLLLVLAGCTGSGDAGASSPTEEMTVDPAVAGEVAAAFATYRTGVAQADGGAVVRSLDEGSLADMQRVVDLARTADESTIRALPAAEQLLVLIYRLRPELLEAEDPYRALVDAGLGGQDRSLGELGEVLPAGDDVAVGVIVDATSGAPTPLRWRFNREDAEWRFDLVNAHRLLSTTISNGAARAGVQIDDLVAATVADLSGEKRAVVEALYTEPPTESTSATE